MKAVERLLQAGKNNDEGETERLLQWCYDACQADPSLFGPPIDHVHGPLHGLDAEPVQKLLEGLAFQASRIERQLSPTSECRCVGVAVA